ncbi:VOC family protein [Emcibacter sp.]|uniref:VOC family protein n=1 Tax=Emcibacter sp. TaxID=1979954 RepID=UPI002AA7499E|nr:VOC family protein [Emcibacter sp.]
MIGYVTLGTNKFEKAAKFYDELLSLYKAGRAIESDRLVAWATGPGSPMVAIAKPWDGKPATVGNGTMISLAAANSAQVDELYAKALELGGSDEGAPGERIPGFYGAYFRDLDGNKLCVFHMDMSAMS